MIPPPFLDWAVWANLDQHRDVELILLKGHLFLEIFLTSGLSLRTSLTGPQIKNLSFSAKARVLAETDEQLSKVLEHAKSLNKLRNKLAHEPFPDELKAELNDWSEQVLFSYSIQKYQKYTSRTKITQAIAALARNIYELSYNELKAVPCSNKE
ncbi:hypothetical protein [Rheinheimera sp. 1928-s]|uniref:hypothetical protein n=1 Tax=Rheinheimera sp. 1928-s TaxID=3033803 RepID=UPI00262F7C8B|nr:hypothetical protein [Rheinheimera sp. 1928-s]MDF3126798.1 hypothetical protein [Rheinheimera sp. 1928-s]